MYNSARTKTHYTQQNFFNYFEADMVNCDASLAARQFFISPIFYLPIKICESFSETLKFANVTDLMVFDNSFYCIIATEHWSNCNIRCCYFLIIF